MAAVVEKPERKFLVSVTGFGPFGKVTSNPSTRLVEGLKKLEHVTSTVTWKLSNASVLEVSKVGVDSELEHIQAKASSLGTYSDHRFVILHLHLGVHGGATKIHIEQQAYNCDDFRIPDQRGLQVRNKKIDPSFGYGAYRTSVDTRKLVRDLNQDRYFCVSDDPGRFLCNHVYFKSLQYCAENKTFLGDANEHHSLFVHIPTFDVIPEEKQLQLIITMLNQVSSDFGRYRKTGRPEPLAPIVDTSESASYKPSVAVLSGAELVENQTANFMKLGLGYPAHLVRVAVQMLVNNKYETDADSIVNCLLSLGDHAASNIINSRVKKKMVILVRQDLAMSPGKIAAQCCHATLGNYRALLHQHNRTLRGDLQQWQAQGEPTIILQVPSANQLTALCRQANAQRIPVYKVHDAGKTQVESGTLTCATLGPADDESIDKITGSLKLLP
jgi:peptidyl-tRNA hydrolase, PTH2 family